MSGKALRPELVRKVRQEEIEYFKAMKVFDKVPISEGIKNTGKQPIGVRWVDVNKQDEDNPKYRSRLVAKEIKRFPVPEDLQCQNCMLLRRHWHVSD